MGYNEDYAASKATRATPSPDVISNILVQASLLGQTISNASEMLQIVNAQLEDLRAYSNLISQKREELELTKQILNVALNEHAALTQRDTLVPLAGTVIGATAAKQGY